MLIQHVIMLILGAPDSSVEDPEKWFDLYDIKSNGPGEVNTDVKLIRKYLEYTKSEDNTICV